MNRALFDFIFHPVVFFCVLLAAHIAIFGTIERLWGQRRIPWREVLGRDLAAALVASFVVVAAASHLNRWIGLRGPWPSEITALPLPARLVLYIVVADFFAYWVHRLAHVSVLWRIHRWHHSPTYMYWFAGTRASILQQTLFNLPYIASPLIDVSPWWMANALLILYSLTNSWMHMNVRWRLRGIDWLLVTPRTHHIHHSEQRDHYNSNFGVILSIWDRLFGTFTNPDRVDPAGIRFGTGEKLPATRLAIGI